MAPIRSKGIVRVRTAAILVAAGRGTRAGGGLPKQWRPLAGRTVAGHALAAFATHPGIDHVVLVAHPEDIAAGHVPEAPQIVAGAQTRSGSVRAGLEAIAGRFDHVLIHDAARPCVSRAVIDDVLQALRTHSAAAPALEITYALWRGAAGQVSGTQPRDGLFRAQTPQGFALQAIVDAHRRFGAEAADDVEIARRAGLTVAITAGSEDNLKVTRAADFARAEAILRRRMDIRFGNGYDVHRFGPGSGVILCGVTVPFDRALQGHSDADVGMHAITDAVYGALAEGDIGRHFPPSDPQWKGAASAVFLEHAVALATRQGYRIGNVDCTLVCELPKIGPHAAAMQAELARVMGIEPGRISVKATTSERLGFTGRGEGIAALATVGLIGA